jgi:phage baseplate assembly protein W
MARIKGIAYPLTKHPQGFFHNAAADVTQIKADMAAIILTEPEERIFELHFGTPLSKLNLNAPAEIVASEARMMIAVALKKWEKRVQVDDVIVNLTNTEDNKLLLKIQVLFIDPVNIRNVQDLILYKSLGGIDGRPMPF